MAKSADATDLKSVFSKEECGFKSRPGHQKTGDLRISRILLKRFLPKGRDQDASPYVLPFNDTICAFNLELRSLIIQMSP